MSGNHFNLDAYLERIRLNRPVPATEDGLELLHRAQIYTIPFENFDVFLGRGIGLEPDVLFKKMVINRRGGYCFELNGLFIQAMRETGFDCRPLLARVHFTGTAGGRTHQLELVTINKRNWIADVGFGHNGLRAPVPLEMDAPREQDGVSYRLVERPPWGTMLQIREGDDWSDLYSFDMEHVSRPDIELGNHFTSTHPSSFFTYSRVAVLPSPEGSTTLMDHSLKEIRGNDIVETEIRAGTGYLEILREKFGIELDIGPEEL